MLRERVYAFLHSRALFVFGIGLALFPGILAGFAGVAYLQMAYFPIVDRFVIDQAELDGKGDVTISGSFYKLYPDWACEFKSMQWYMPAQDPDGNKVRLRVASEYGDKRPVPENNNRPKGYSAYHDWKIGISEYPDQHVFAGFATHRCLWFIPTRTHLIEYEAPPRRVTPIDSIH